MQVKLNLKTHLSFILKLILITLIPQKVFQLIRRIPHYVQLVFYVNRVQQFSLHPLPKLNLNFDTIFANTNTSYNPDKEWRSSGKSGADIERILAFNAIGRKDPVPYTDDWSKVLEHAIQTEKKHKEKI